MRALLTVMFIAALLVAAMGVLRVPFAVRFWRRMQWVAWVYIAVVVLSALRLWFLG